MMHFLLAALFITIPQCAPLQFQPLGVGILQQIQRDWSALNQRSTTRHLMRPLSDSGRQQCLALKQAARQASSNGAFVVDAFAEACRVHSCDEESARQGGLLGELLPQGSVRSSALDQACFTAPLGVVAGPLKSEFGWHLVLVCERTGCCFDEGMTRVVAEPTDNTFPGTSGALASLQASSSPLLTSSSTSEVQRYRSVLAPEDPAIQNERKREKPFSETALGLVFYWGSVVVAGTRVLEETTGMHMPGAW
mmetsp:Transcript_1204/g.2307  ORF Transcript_1204/g.2307 Transcript_1204/m.2307 type:complete len:251 (-) Transcript_1204:204-956(-)